MKNTILISALAALAVAALITSSNLTAQDVPDDKPAKQQKVILLQLQRSLVMNGDNATGKSKISSLPVLLKKGWRVVEIFPSGGDGGAAAYALLEK